MGDELDPTRASPPTAPLDGSAEPGPRSTRRATRRRCRRRRLLVVGGVVALVLIVGGVAFAVASSGGGHRAAPAAKRHPATTTVPTSTTSTTPAAPTTTTVIPRSSNPVVALAQQYDGLYVGSFTNTTFHTTGTATLQLQIDPTAATLNVNVDLTGDLFGGGAKAVRKITGQIKLGDPTAPVSMQTSNFGPVTGRLGQGVSIILTAPNVPDPKVQSFTLNGQLRQDTRGFDATFTIGFRDGSSAQGTVTVVCASYGQRPSQVRTLCA